MTRSCAIPTSILFLSINVDLSKAAVHDYLAAAHVKLCSRQYPAGPGVRALSSAIGAQALPITLSFDARGRLVERRMGELSAASLAGRLADIADAHQARHGPKGDVHFTTTWKSNGIFDCPHPPQRRPFRGVHCPALRWSDRPRQFCNAHPKAIRRAVDSGVKVVKQFPAVSGLTGWVLIQHGHYSTVYTTADKKTLLAGALIGEGGESMSALYEEKHVPKPDLGRLFQQLEKSSYVAEGPGADAKTSLYVFVDANCPYCHSAWLALQPYEKAGLQVRWIPVATLGPTSMPKAIEVIAARDKLAAFRAMEVNHGKPGPLRRSQATPRNRQPRRPFAVTVN